MNYGASEVMHSDLTSHEELNLIMPSNWSRSKAPDGNFIYFDPLGEVHVEHPLIHKARTACLQTKTLPDGWREHPATLEDGSSEVYYTNAALGLSMWDHPQLRSELAKLELEVQAAEEKVRSKDVKLVNSSTANSAGVNLKDKLTLRLGSPSSPSSPSVYSRGGVQRMTPRKKGHPFFGTVGNDQQKGNRSQQQLQTLDATSPTKNNDTYLASPQQGFGGGSQVNSTIGGRGATGFPDDTAVSVHEQQRLSKHASSMNVMNHHRLIEFRNLAKNSFYFYNQGRGPYSAAPMPPCFDVPASDPFSHMVKILQRSPKIIAANLQKLFSAGRYEDSARMSHFLTHVLLNPFSTDQR